MAAGARLGTSARFSHHAWGWKSGDFSSGPGADGNFGKVFRKSVEGALTWRNRHFDLDEMRPWPAHVDLDQHVATGSLLFILRVFQARRLPAQVFDASGWRLER
jgi:hypothetical protein